MLAAKHFHRAQFDSKRAIHNECRYRLPLQATFRDLTICTAALSVMAPDRHHREACPIHVSYSKDIAEIFTVRRAEISDQKNERQFYHK